MIDIPYPEFVETISEFLRIPTPTISSDTSGFSKTQIAEADIANNKIRIKTCADERDTYFAIAHELRHFWQSRHGFDFDSHESNKSVSANRYNSQEEEIDANAFGVIVMSEFGVRPLFTNLDEPNKKLIYDRADEIAKYSIF